MPNVTAPAALEYTGGAIRCSRPVPARLAYTAGNLSTSASTTTTTAAEIPKLDRLRRFDTLVRGNEVDPRFQLIWQQTMEAIEGAFEAVNARVDEVAILARLSNVESLAAAANDNAVAAQATATQVSEAAKQTFSTIDPNLADTFDDFNTP